MEAYKSYCPECKKTYFWQGYKTGLGKSTEQLAAMKRRDTVCKHCGGDKLETTLDRESELGKEYDAIYSEIGKHIAGIISEKLG